MKRRLRHNARHKGFTMVDEASEQLDEATAPVQEEPTTDAVADVPAEPVAPEMAFSWQASEYVHHHKSASWYVVLAVTLAALVAGALFLRLWLYVGVFLIMGVAVVVYARKPPRTMTYELSSEGVHVDGKLFPFSAFRSFGVLPDEEWHSIDLEPAKAFNPRMVLLFDTNDLDAIVGHLELHLPRMDRQPDIIERITRYLRF
jgi:hypothetical protein